MLIYSNPRSFLEQVINRRAQDTLRKRGRRKNWMFKPGSTSGRLSTGIAVEVVLPVPHQTHIQFNNFHGC